MLGKKNKTLGSILESFTKTIDDLDALFSRNVGQQKANQAAAERIAQHQPELSVEAARVSKIQENLRALIAE